MAITQLLSRRSFIPDTKGNPARGHYVHILEPGTETRVTSYEDGALQTANANPVPLDAAGKASIWVSRNVDVRITDGDDLGDPVLVEELNANPDELGSAEDSGLVPNGSFENDTDADDVPDGWTLTNETGSNNSIDTSVSSAGGQSFRFTSTGDGGGTLQSTDFFPVNDSEDLRVQFDIRSSVVDVRNIVRVRWYDVSEVAISNTDVYDNDSSNPTSFVTQNLLATPPSGARFAKLDLIGCDPSDSTPGSTYFDRVRVFYPLVVSGVFDNLTIQDNEIISTNTNGVIELKPNGTGQLRIESVAAVVRHPTADDPQIHLEDSAGNVLAHVIHTGTTDLRIKSLEHGLPVYLAGEDAGGTERIIVGGDPDDDSGLYRAGTMLLGTDVAGAQVRHPTADDPNFGFRDNAGGVLTNLIHIGTSRFEIRQMEHGLPIRLASFNAGGSLQTLAEFAPGGAAELNFSGVTTLATAANGAIVADDSGDTPLLQFNDDAGARVGFIQFHASNGVIFENESHGTAVELRSEDTGGVNRALFRGLPDSTATLYYAGVDSLRTADHDATDYLSGAEVKDYGGTWRQVGFLNAEHVSVVASQNITRDDWGKTMRVTASGVTLTIDEDSDLSPHVMVTILARSDDVAIARGAGMTLRWFDGGGADPGNADRTLAHGGVATIWRFTDTEYYIWGVGLS